ncbi:hypothetical protein SLA2020_198900 [Shorea laevis]
MEEEATNGIFSMKSDHVFNELSDSEDCNSESWSLNSGFEGACGESVHGGGWYTDSRKDTEIRNGIEVVEGSDDVDAGADVVADVGIELRQEIVEGSDDVDARTGVIADVEIDEVADEEESLNESSKEATARGRQFEFANRNAEESRMIGEESNQWIGNECSAESIGKTQKSFINIQGKTRVGVDYVSDTFSEHLMRS